MIEASIGRIAAGEDLTQAEMADVLDRVFAGQCSAQEIAVFLTGLTMKGETFAEIAGAAQSLRRHMTPIRSHREGVLDTCGTGGDASGTFNISTAAAIVIAAAGVPVAKHGNRRATSTSGSADVLAALGVNVEASIERVEQCLEDLGLCFCFAPLFHGAMKQVAQVRRQLGLPTIFNLLGPLSNPAGAQHQLLGVGRPDRRHQIAQALALLGTKHSLVVTGEDGLDEVTLATVTDVIAVNGTSREFRWQPEDFGIQRAALDALRIDGPIASAALIDGILRGESGPARDIVLLNAAAGLMTVGKTDSPADGAAMAAEAIDSGRARQLLAQLVALTNR